MFFGPDGIMEMIEAEKKRGRIRNVGFSAHSEEQAIHAMDLYDFDTLMFPINWQMIKRDAWGTKAIAEANKRNMGVLAIKGLAHRSW